MPSCLMGTILLLGWLFRECILGPDLLRWLCIEVAAGVVFFDVAVLLVSVACCVDLDHNVLVVLSLQNLAAMSPSRMHLWPGMDSAVTRP